MLNEYKHYAEKGIKHVEVILIDDCLHYVPINSIVGFCHCKVHTGHLLKSTMKEHECISKQCPFFHKFEDYPYWVGKENRKKEIEKQKKKQQYQNNMKIHFQRRFENVRRIAQNAIDVRGLPILVTSVALQKPNKYILNYVSNESRDDVQTKKDLSVLKDFFNVGNNEFLNADRFCSKDGVFKLEEFYNAISNNRGDTFVIGLTAFLKLQGKTYIEKVLKELLSKNISGHIVILTYQCRDYLSFSDTRFLERGQIVLASGEQDAVPDICLVAPSLAEAFPNSYKGIEKISLAVENDTKDTIYLATSVEDKLFEKSIYSVFRMSNGYDILCNRDSRTKSVPASFGTDKHWNYALKLMGLDGDWMTIAVQKFGSISNLSRYIVSFLQFEDEKKWLYFILLSIFGSKDNRYLQLAVQSTYSYVDLIKSVYRAILSVDKKHSNFKSLYDQRKAILKELPKHSSEVVELCKVVSVKEKDAIYYLTDITQPEKERIIEWLDVYGYEYDTSELLSILRIVYPDLAKYLSPFRYKNDFLNKYFSEYKYQKVINKILPSFESVVDEQSYQYGFMDMLQARTTLIDKIDVTDSQAYFFDALGVEYLAFIQDKCNDYELSADISCARCELPSLTSYNKEFVDTFEAKGCKISDIKDLDKIKHHGENNFNYEKVKIPIYLITELEIIDSLLKKVKSNVDSGVYKKAIIVSDHGASRLAVLHNTENIWSMATNGVHSGRCCPKNEIDTKPDFAIEEDDFWVLANYDRFRGSRKANCEVHGGATLEEVAVPIIEITKKQLGIEAFIVESSKVITLGAKEHAVIKIYVGVKSNNIAIKIDGKYYDAEPTSDKYIYKIDLVDYTKKGKYTCDILNGNDAVATNQYFEIKKKGMSENNLFG